MSAELKEIRKKWKDAEAKVVSWQLWAERQVAKGLLDIEQTPGCFDRTKNTLHEMIDNDHTIGSHCHFCGHKFEVGEAKVTNNHIMWFHPGCETAYDKMESKTEKFENRESD